MAKRFGRWSVGLLGLVVACTTPQTIPLQMSAQYGCPADSVTVSNIDGNNYRGEGCGHVETFVCTMPTKAYLGPNSEQQCFRATEPDAGVAASPRS